LHKCNTLTLYHPQLACCTVQFLEKEQALTKEVVGLLLRIWPKVNSSKEILFLDEIEEILDEIDPEEFKKIQVPLFKRIGQCVASMNFQVYTAVVLYFTGCRTGSKLLE
jgi:serine/threonine-protein phosphatase 2A regulatory subunit B'